MWAYIVRRIVYNIPVYLAIVFLVMALLRVKDPIAGQLGKNATEQDYQDLRVKRGLDKPFLYQYAMQLKSIATFNFNRELWTCLLYTSPSPRDATLSRMPSSA